MIQYLHDYETPDEFIVAVKKLLSITEFEVDLAADEKNSKAVDYYEENSLQENWETSKNKYAWLNPPHNNIKPWVIKAFSSRDHCNTAMLVPASVGSDWFRDWVYGKANILFLNGRITFVGCNAPYSKDYMLLIYGLNTLCKISVWDWRTGRIHSI